MSSNIEYIILGTSKQVLINGSGVEPVTYRILVDCYTIELYTHLSRKVKHIILWTSTQVEYIS